MHIHLQEFVLGLGKAARPPTEVFVHEEPRGKAGSPPTALQESLRALAWQHSRRSYTYVYSLTHPGRCRHVCQASGRLLGPSPPALLRLLRVVCAAACKLRTVAAGGYAVVSTLVHFCYAVCYPNYAAWCRGLLTPLTCRVAGLIAAG
eukprot:366055-Chlamydomonas_euryale.AAC.15